MVNASSSSARAASSSSPATASEQLLCNGTPVVAAKITRPRLGSWVAELVVDADEASTWARVPSSPTAMGRASSSAPCSAARSPRTPRAAGDLRRRRTRQDPRRARYHQAPPRVILTDLAREIGETLAPLDEAVLDAPLRARARPRRRRCRSCASSPRPWGSWALSGRRAAMARSQTWLDAGLVEGRDYELLHDEPARHRWTVSTVTLADAVRIAPGTVLDGRRVSFVEHNARAGFDAHHRYLRGRRRDGRRRARRARAHDPTGDVAATVLGRLALPRRRTAKRRTARGRAGRRDARAPRARCAAAAFDPRERARAAGCAYSSSTPTAPHRSPTRASSRRRPSTRCVSVAARSASRAQAIASRCRCGRSR